MKYYEDEQKMFQFESDWKFVNEDEVSFYFQRLKDRFKFPHVINFRGGIWSGATCRRDLITFPRPVSALTLCHEIAHGIQMKTHKQGERWHTKKHQRIMSKVIQYFKENQNLWIVQFCIRRNHIAEQVKKRGEVVAAQKAWKSSSLGKLERILKAEHLWLKKGRLAATKLKKLQRQKRFYIKKIKESNQPNVD